MITFFLGVAIGAAFKPAFVMMKDIAIKLYKESVKELDKKDSDK